MPDIFFVFGPNGSYFLDTPKIWKYGGLPSGLWEELNGSASDTIRDPHWIGLGPNGLYYCGYESKGGANYVVSNVKQSLPFLKNWMDEKVPTGSDLHVVFGSEDKSYIAYADGAGSVWSNIPSGLEESIQKRADSPAQVALGKGGAYYVRWWKGDCTYALRTNYPDADKIIDDADSPPEFVALNPYETDQYFIVLANGEVHWRIPSASSSTVQDVIRVNHGSAVAEYPRSDDRHTLENVRTGLSIGASALSIGHTVAGIAGGAALCNVM